MALNKECPQFLTAWKITAILLAEAQILIYYCFYVSLEEERVGKKKKKEEMKMKRSRKLRRHKRKRLRD